jgi:hypothetical protein
MGWARLQTRHLLGQKWSSHWETLGYVKLRFCHSTVTSYNCMVVILTLI